MSFTKKFQSLHKESIDFLKRQKVYFTLFSCRNFPIHLSMNLCKIFNQSKQIGSLDITSAFYIGYLRQWVYFLKLTDENHKEVCDSRTVGCGVATAPEKKGKSSNAGNFTDIFLYAI